MFFLLKPGTKVNRNEQDSKELTYILIYFITNQNNENSPQN